jgi:hypothetical protein
MPRWKGKPGQQLTTGHYVSFIRRMLKTCALCNFFKALSQRDMIYCHLKTQFLINFAHVTIFTFIFLF